MCLQGKKVIVGVTGGIAAYKSASLVRLFKKAGAEVKVIMTNHAKEFITPLTMATVSQNPILVEFFNPENGEWNSHVSLGEWADVLVIAPATANTMGKMACGIADNLLITTYLSARCPIVVAPAMDLDMYAHPTTNRSLDILKGDGVLIVEPESGFLASGLSGKGRMAEPETILEFVATMFQDDNNKPLRGKKALISVGGTVERIDAVRFISNYSTGKMGYALAEVLVNYGADVTIVRGNVNDNLIGSISSAKEIEALSAEEMYVAINEECTKNDILIMTAAVADFTPKNKVDYKIKKSDTNNSSMVLELTETKDIAASIGQSKRENQILVGFALETNDEEINANAKMSKKNLDFIVLNSLNDSGAGFGYDTNKVTIYSKDGGVKPLDLCSKKVIAKDIIDTILIR